MKDHQMVRLASLQHRVARIEKEASQLFTYNPNAGKKPLNFSKPWTLTKANLSDRLMFLQAKERKGGRLTQDEKQESVKIKSMMRRG